MQEAADLLVQESASSLSSSCPAANKLAAYQ